jgi:serine/threonine-protein kinase
MEVLPMPGANEILHPGDRDRSDVRSRPSDEPRSVAGYRLLRRVGEGGMSTVYLSYDVPARRAVAVKLLADHLSGQQEFVNRFYREARLSRLVRHANIVQGFAAGYDPEACKHYLVLEFIDGPSAHAAMARLGRVPTGVAVRIGIDIARALQFLHARNYVHRDVKPDNVLLHPDGVAKLADLGLTKRLNDDTHLTSINQGVGTSYYMPYEQALNAALVDGRSDIFALGATLYHLLTGQVPFQGSTHEEIIRGKENEEFRPVRELNPDVPLVLDEILAATLARDPRNRFQRAADLAAALDATGLAVRIPSFAPSGGGTGPPPQCEEPTPPEAPTRADLPVRAEGLDTPPDVHLRAGVPPLGRTAVGTDRVIQLPKPPSGPGSSVPLLVGATVMLTGLLGWYCTTPNRVPGGPAPTTRVATDDRSPLPRAGLPVPPPR